MNTRVTLLALKLLLCMGGSSIALADSPPIRVVPSQSSRATTPPTASPTSESPQYSDSEYTIHAEAGLSGPVVVIDQQGKEDRFELPVMAFVVKRIYRSADRLVIVSNIEETSDTANGVTIFDLERHAVLGGFYGYQVTPSPDIQNIAYARFYPLHYTPGTEDQIYVYAVNGDDALPVNGSRKGVVTFDAAGTQILVDLNQQRGTSNIGVTNQRIHNLVGAFSWSADGKSFGLVSGVGSQRSLVVASGALKTWRVLSYAITNNLPAFRELVVSDLAQVRPTLFAITNSDGTSQVRQRLHLAEPVNLPQ